MRIFKRECQAILEGIRVSDFICEVDVVNNNVVETFNAYIVYIRAKHCIDMLQSIIILLMERMFVKKGMMETAEDEIYPRITVKLKKEKQEVKNYNPIPSCNKVFK